MSDPAAFVRSIHDALNATAVARPVDVVPPRRAPPATLALPVPPRPAADLGEVLHRRRSTYRFPADQPPLEDVATLLHHGVGTAPRAGGLPSLVPYVVARRPGAVPAGVHRADLRLPAPGLVAVRAGDPTAHVAASLDQPAFAPRVPLWLALVADLGATLPRYPPRHYRTLHLDAGVALQGVLLLATALGLPTCPVMGYDDRAWSRLLALDDGAFVAVLVAVGGRPGRQPE